MKKEILYNKKNKKDLIADLNREKFNRITCSFYKYVILEDLQKLRDRLYVEFSKQKIFGRIYLAEEGINAQVSIPEYNKKLFISYLDSIEEFKNLNLKGAIEEGESFYKLVIKIKNEIVAYKIDNTEYDMNRVGKYLNFNEFNDAIDNGAYVIDIRNQYESEVGRFENAILPDSDRSEDLLPIVKKLLDGHQDDKIIMYCTGGIRCEKASSYLIKQGFKDVNQLKGGIIQYTNDIKQNRGKTKFIGKNFVFDNRMGENITKDIISKCHQCNEISNKHINCNNPACHILFIQCDKCANKFNNCCSMECCNYLMLSAEEQKIIMKRKNIIFNGQKSDRLRPKLKEIYDRN